jgi:plastocyanin
LSHHKHLAVVDDTLSGAAPDPVMAAGEARARASVMAAGGAAGTSAAKPSDGAAQVGIDNFAFNPKTLAVKSGQTVTWTNHDDVPHRIQSANDKFPPSSVLDTKALYTVTLTPPGEYPYFCSLHPTMIGTIIVT